MKNSPLEIFGMVIIVGIFFYALSRIKDEYEDNDQPANVNQSGSERIIMVYNNVVRRPARYVWQTVAEPVISAVSPTPKNTYLSPPRPSSPPNPLTKLSPKVRRYR